MQASLAPRATRAGEPGGMVAMMPAGAARNAGAAH
jgi:hypothetical protein